MNQTSKPFAKKYETNVLPARAKSAVTKGVRQKKVAPEVVLQKLKERNTK